jgi:hypothetical protein
LINYGTARELINYDTARELIYYGTARALINYVTARALIYYVTARELINYVTARELINYVIARPRSGRGNLQKLPECLGDCHVNTEKQNNVFQCFLAMTILQTAPSQGRYFLAAPCNASFSRKDNQ